ncbi:MAG: DUF58 domain-containing protein, partial [Acidobacteriota bacterium]|nr:DUF58 domain-containing protein [Acidobacteriota bacterium]
MASKDAPATEERGTDQTGFFTSLFGSGGPSGEPEPPAGVSTAELLARVRHIEIRTRKLVTEALAGAYLSTFKGQGMEFSEVREYAPGDDIRSVDWNVTSRTGNLHVKKFVEEREQTVLFLLDVSRSFA